MFAIKKKFFTCLLGGIILYCCLCGSAGAAVFDVYFIHLSTGENWLDSGNGGLRKAVNKAKTLEGHTFQMHDSHTGNTDHREWLARFKNNEDWKNYEIVMFKSCFPASHIDSGQMLNEYKKVYGQMKNRYFKKNPNILFVIVIAPPLVPNETNQNSANRARTFNNWLKSRFLEQYNTANPGLNNLAVFDFFDILANSSAPNRNMLKKRFRLGAWDSHPNKKGSRMATRMFVPFLELATDNWAETK